MYRGGASPFNGVFCKMLIDNCLFMTDATYDNLRLSSLFKGVSRLFQDILIEVDIDTLENRTNIGGNIYFMIDYNRYFPDKIGRLLW